MRSSAPSLRIRVIVLCAVAFATLSVVRQPAIADEALMRKTFAGREVLIRGFAEFGADCKLRHVQTITVVDAPLHGRVVQRPGEVTIGDNWVGDKSCAGARLDGVRVYYVPDEGFTGSDRFSMDVRYASQRTVRANVEISVDAGTGGDVRG